MSGLRCLAIFAVLFVCLPALAQQKDDDAAREKQRRQGVLIESLIADGRELKLPENRALLFARIGTRTWDIDRKRAEDLFQQSIVELLAAQAEAEADRLRGRHNELLTGGNTRPQVLQAIAARDADLALKSLYRTRPAAIERAVNGAGSKDLKIRNASGNDFYLVQNELNLEQNLARMAADQNPERAVELLKAVLKKGVTSEVLPLLRKVHDKDPAAAAELGSEAIGILMRKNFVNGGQPDYSAIQTGFTFLNDHIRERPASDKTFRFASSEMRSLADKFISLLLDRTNPGAISYSHQMVPIAEKMRPDAVEKLKEAGKAAYSRHGGLQMVTPEPELAKLMNVETPIEEVLAGAPKLATENRRQVYHNVANRLIASGDVGRARQVIEDNFSEDALANARESMNWYHVHQLMNQGKFAEAETLIAEFPTGNRFTALLALAEAVFNRNREENKTQALAILHKAGADLSIPFETNVEMQQATQLIAVFSRVEPPEAFRVFDTLVPQINELAEASAVLSGFQGNHGFRRGEMLISMGSTFGVHIDGSILGALAQKDFDRTLALIGTFARREMRVAMKQQLLESIN